MTAADRQARSKLLEDCSALKCPSPASSIAFHFSRMTNSILDDTELEEQNPEPEEQESEEEEEDKHADKEERMEEEEDNSEEKKPMKISLTLETKLTDSAKESAGKSVRFDKLEEDPDDAYDFNTDFN